MRDLDSVALPHNTPDSRAALVNAPRWADGYTLETFVVAAGTTAPSEFAGWLSASVAERSAQRSVVLYGPPGSGKTGLGVCALRALARAAVGSTFQWNMSTSPGVRAAVESGEDQAEPSPCWFERWSRLLALYRRERWDEEGWFEQLERAVTVLMLDDIGVDAGTPFRESFLLRHIEWALDRGRSLVLTLNAPPPRWSEVLGERAADRLQDSRWFRAVALNFGKSLR
jgi:DNA replication protein DnaC